MNKEVHADKFFWALQTIFALHRKPFSPELARQQLAAPHNPDSLSRAANAFGFDASLHKLKSEKLHKGSFPLIAWLSPMLIDGNIDPAADVPNYLGWRWALASFPDLAMT